MISIKGLDKKFEDKTIFSEVNLEVLEGEMLILFGKNGSGKTTLLKCICGLLKYNRGLISLTEVESNEIGLVLDENLLIPKLKVKEYLALMLKLKCNIIDNLVIERFLISIDLVKQKKEFVGKLSKGSKSKLLLISALITKPKLIILDEPFRGMDLVAFEKAFLLIRNFHQEGGTVVLSTHRTGLVKDLNLNTMVLKNGKVEKMKYNISERALINYLKSES